ncbi:hypothetical protein ACTGUP_10175, partial [Streptococcus suis]
PAPAGSWRSPRRPNMKTGIRMTVLRNLFLLSACVTTPAFAQTAAPDDTARRDDIIVILTLFRGIDAAVRWAPQCRAKLFPI